MDPVKIAGQDVVDLFIARYFLFKGLSWITGTNRTQLGDFPWYLDIR